MCYWCSSAKLFYGYLLSTRSIKVLLDDGKGKLKAVNKPFS